MGLEQLNTSKLIGPQQDVETIETWADRNGIIHDHLLRILRGVTHNMILNSRHPLAAVGSRSAPKSRC